MSKLVLPQLNLAPFTVMGSSIAGVATAFIVKELNLCFDVANGWQPLTTVKNILLSHGHSDHAGGLPYVLSQKGLTSQPPPKIYMPETLVQPMTEIIRLWEKIEGHQYDFHFTPVELGREYPLKGRYSFKAFPTVHRIPSNGYTIFESKKQLNEEFAGKERQEILEAKGRGIEVEKKSQTPLLSFTGDTQIEFLDGPDWVRQSKYLIMEVSFLDNRRSVAETRKWGHIHFEEFLENLSRIESEKIILIHLSKRYQTHEAEKLLEKKGIDPARVLVFPQINW